MGINASLTGSSLFCENLLGKCFDFLPSMPYFQCFLLFFCPSSPQTPRFSLPGFVERDDLKMHGEETQIMVTGSWRDRNKWRSRRLQSCNVLQWAGLEERERLRGGKQETEKP